MSPKKHFDQITATAKAWKELRSKKSFADMTLAKYDETVKPSLEARDEITDLRVQLKDAIARRNTADKVSCAVCLDVGRAVAGDTSEGPDSPFYKALGYVPVSERKSGLGRKNKAVLKAA